MAFKATLSAMALAAISIAATTWHSDAAAQPTTSSKLPSYLSGVDALDAATLVGDLDAAERLARREFAEQAKASAEKRGNRFGDLAEAAMRLSAAHVFRGKAWPAMVAGKLAADAAYVNSFSSMNGDRNEQLWEEAIVTFAQALTFAGRTVDAEQILLRTHEILDQSRKSYLPLFLNTAPYDVTEQLAFHYLLRGDYPKALSFAATYQTMVAPFAKTPELRNSKYTVALVRGLSQCALGNFPESKSNLAIVTRFLERYPADKLPVAARINALRAQCALASNQPDQAFALAEVGVTADKTLVRAAGLQQENPVGSLMDADGTAELTLLHAGYQLRGGKTGRAPRAFDDELFVAAQYARLTTTQIAVQRAAAQHYGYARGKGGLLADLLSLDKVLTMIDAAIVDASQAWISKCNEADYLLQSTTRATTRRGDYMQTPDEQRRIRALYEQSDALAREVITAVAPRAAAEAARDEAARRVAAELPGYAPLLETRPELLSALQGNRRAAGLLGSDEAMILITPGSMRMPAGYRRGFALVVTQGQPPQWAVLGMEPDVLAREIEALRHDLDPPHADARGRTRPPGTLGDSEYGPKGFDRARARALYDALFGAPQTAAALKGKTKWIVVPQGELLSLPLSALVTGDYPGGKAGDADPAALRSTPWLGAEKILSVLPTVSSLALLREGQGIPAAPASPGKRLFGIGEPHLSGPTSDAMGPVNEGTSVWHDGRADRDAILSLPPINPPALRRIAHALRMPAENLLIGDDATEARLRAAADQLTAANVVIFNTHGLTASNEPGALAEPALVLMPPLAGMAGGSDNDGLLTAGEAAELRLPADWVVLSACNTAAGDGTAEGLSGLARAFFVAGARGLLVSQWRAQTEAAAALIPDTIAMSVDHDQSRAQALQRAMIALMQRTDRDDVGRSFAHPSAWAVFEFVGADKRGQ